MILQSWPFIKRATADPGERLSCTAANAKTLRPEMTPADARAAVRFVLRDLPE